MEMEIKLGPAEPELAERIFSDLTLLPEAGAPEQIQMRTEYYDTPERELARRAQMIRLRWENGRGICTFKGPAEDCARLELECAAQDVEVGAAVLAVHPQMPAEAAALLAAGGLVPVCGAAFLRKSRLCRWGDSRIILCLDQGQLEKGTLRKDFCEVELELYRGSAADLKEAAQAVVQTYGIPVCGKSKEQQAMSLGDPQ